MKILIVASECSPVVKIGGLGDVVGSLPKALKKLGMDVRIVIPAYKSVLDSLVTPKFTGPSSEPRNAQPPFSQGTRGLYKGLRTNPNETAVGVSSDSESSAADTRLGDFVVHYGGEAQKVVLHQIALPGTDIPLYLIENKKYISGGGVYMDPSGFANSQDEIERFAFFSKAVVEIFVAREDVFFPDVVHCNDWHTGMIPQLIKAEARYIELSRPATVFTIHNLANQGISQSDVIERLDGEELFKSPYVRWDAADDNLDFVMQGILGSDVVNTVSKFYSEEIKTPEYGEGLNEVIKAREARVFGILNGIDKEAFDPEKDSYLKVNYPTGSLEKLISGKLENKKLLRKELNLQEKDAPLIGFVSRITKQKGVDILVSLFDELISIGFQVAVLGTGDKSLEDMITSKVADPKCVGNCAGIIKFDEGMARRIYASSDMFAIPSRFEPCGLTQMIAMRYGAVPIVRAVGGLKDTVKDNFTGFVFNTLDPNDFLAAVRRAKRAYEDTGIWRKIISNCVSADFSWDKSAREYVTLYGKALTFANTKIS